MKAQKDIEVKITLTLDEDEARYLMELTNKLSDDPESNDTYEIRCGIFEGLQDILD